MRIAVPPVTTAYRFVLHYSRHQYTHHFTMPLTTIDEQLTRLDVEAVNKFLPTRWARWVQQPCRRPTRACRCPRRTRRPFRRA